VGSIMVSDRNTSAPLVVYMRGNLENAPEFYKKFEEYMERKEPDPFFRPIVYVQASSDPKKYQDNEMDALVKANLLIDLGNNKIPDYDELMDAISSIIPNVDEQQSIELHVNIHSMKKEDGSKFSQIELYQHKVADEDWRQSIIKTVRAQGIFSWHNKDNKKTISLVGGMGPTAGADFMVNVANTIQQKAKIGSPGYIVTMYSNPAFKRKNDDGFSSWISSFMDSRGVYKFFSRLKNYLSLEGERTYSLTSNTAHAPILYNFCETSIGPKAKFEHMVNAVANRIEQDVFGNPEAKERKILILATTNAVQSNIYQAAFAGKSCSDNIIHLSPSSAEQEKVQQCIDKIKHGEIADAGEALKECIFELCKTTGVRSIMLCCTEFPVVVTEKFIKEFNDSYAKILGEDVSFYNATKIAAENVVEKTVSVTKQVEKENVALPSNKDKAIFQGALNNIDAALTTAPRTLRR